MNNRVLLRLLFIFLAFPILASGQNAILQFGSISTSTYKCTSAFQAYFGNGFVNPKLDHVVAALHRTRCRTGRTQLWQLTNDPA